MQKSKTEEIKIKINLRSMIKKKFIGDHETHESETVYIKHIQPYINVSYVLR